MRRKEEKISRKRAIRALWVVVMILVLWSVSCIASVVRAEEWHEFEFDHGVTVLWSTAKSDGGLPPPVRFTDPEKLGTRCGEVFTLSGGILRIGCPGSDGDGGTLYFGTLGVGLWLYLDRVVDESFEQDDPRVSCPSVDHCFVGNPDENIVVEGTLEGGDSIAVVTLSFAGVSLHPGDRFGSSVWTGDGEHLVVGASNFGGNGRAFVFRRTGLALFTLTGVCEDPFAPSGGEFGARVLGTARGEVFAAAPGNKEGAGSLLVCHFPPEEVYPSEIFSDGYESGDLSRWSAAVE